MKEVLLFAMCAAIAALPGSHAAEPAEGASLEEGEKLVLWERSINLRGAFGYKDNVLLSRFQDESSPFWQTSADFFLFRLGDTPWSLTFFATGEDRRYFSSESVDSEQLLLTHLQLSRELGENWEMGTELEYYYIDQVVDVSATEAIFESLPVKSHSLVAAPFISRTLPRDMEVKLEFEVTRQFYNEPLDDYWELGPELTFSKEYGHRSEVSLLYGFRERNYDTRRHFGLDFISIPDTELKFHQHDTELTLSHNWNEERRWRSRLRLGFELNEDNGRGFFDYRKYRLAKRFSYVGETWEASLEGRILWYDYLIQPVVTGGDTRERTEYMVNFRLQKRFIDKLLWFFESEHEWSRSNILVDQYQVNTLMSGVDWEF